MVFDQRSSAKISGEKGFDFLRASVLLIANFFVFCANSVALIPLCAL